MIALLILLPTAAGGLLWLTKRTYGVNLAVALTAAAAHFLLALRICRAGAGAQYAFAPFGFSLVFRTDAVSDVYLLLAAGMFVLLAVYTCGYCRGKTWGGAYQFCLWLSLSMLDGAVLADHLALLLFFWEGLLCTLFGMLLLRNSAHPHTAVKALTVSGTADLLLMLGIALTIRTAGTARISEMSGLAVSGAGAAGFICLMAGALGKAGSMPFHSWIPDAAQDAPTPFLAAFPGSLEKIAGVYLATRALTQIYDCAAGSAACIGVMTVGAVTLLGGVCMALVQKDMKRLLAFHAISQVGYIILGIGSGLAVGLAGGVFHMLNHILYKTGLFMAAGAVELQAGTTDLHKLGGLRRKMPVTAVCTIVFALCIAGFPGTNGFISKELIFDAALEIHPLFYAAALLGAFLTAVSFLKLTRAAFFGAEKAPASRVREARPSMLAPMIALALGCAFCAWASSLPLDRWIGAAYGLGETFADRPKSAAMVATSCCALALAAADHIYGSRKTGSALQAADHLHNLPGVKQVYDAAEKGALDPYNWLMGAARGFSAACVWLEKGVSWIYDRGLPGAVRGTGDALSRSDNGSLSRYLILAACGLAAVGLLFWLA